MHLGCVKKAFDNIKCRFVTKKDKYSLNPFSTPLTACFKCVNEKLTYFYKKKLLRAV